MTLRRAAWMGLVLLAAAWLEPAAAIDREVYSEEGSEACIDCHDTSEVRAIAETAHGDLSDPDTPAARRECQSCHGPSALHMNFPMQVANVHFGLEVKTPPERQNAMCLDCHGDDASGAHWPTSGHGREDVVCSACHGGHDPARVMPSVAKTTDGCMDAGCHPDIQRDAAWSDFSHPVGEKLGEHGLLTCAGCHDPHGPLGSARCLDCHPRTQEVMAQESAKAKRFHEVAERRGTECIRCHKGIGHPIDPLVLEEGLPE